MSRVKFISYDGRWPNLCSGTLVLEIDGKKMTFPKYCLSSGGRAYFTNHYANYHIKKGKWSVKDWPKNFPEELKEEATEVINENISEGCCGGCL